MQANQVTRMYWPIWNAFNFLSICILSDILSEFELIPVENNYFSDIGNVLWNLEKGIEKLS